MTVHELLFFSDHHAHNHKYGSKRREYVQEGKTTLHNSRLLDSVDVLNEITHYAKYHNIPHIIFGGDLFHTRGLVPIDVLNLTYKAIEEMPTQDMDWHPSYLSMIPGNHDFGDREGLVHSLELLPSNIAVYDTPQSVSYPNDLVLHFVPYSDTLGKTEESINSLVITPEATNILVCHAGIQGAIIGSDYVLIDDSDVDISKIDLSRFTACFFGHFHKHQRLAANAWYIGATHQHNWGDAGDPRGFLHVTIKDEQVSIKHIESKAPKFVHIYEGEELRPMPNDFVRYHGNLDSKDEYTRVYEALGSPSNFEVLGTTTAPSKHDDTIELSTDTLLPTNLVKYWNSLHNRADELSAMGLELLSAAAEGEQL